ncbi:hypothetical protein [Paenibacillus dakarensis]|uniref:hypothetical protein n=1 Tax=Paenibacillus dakarensis TaxID=1527293 RepID=UPI000A6498A5|nr:hypothetical protein [Paenibacillus dakarensis]
MLIIIIIIFMVGLFGIISNQYAGLRRMERLQKTLDEINTGIKTMNEYHKNQP